MKTTLLKLISEIDFKNKSMFSDVDWTELSNLFGIYNLDYSNDERLKAYFIRTWYCTDSYVGLRAYFLDGEFVAISFQSGRKANEDFDFASEFVAKKVKDYLLSLVEKENGIKVSVLSDKELNDEIPNTYKIEYNSQIRHATALLNEEKVSIIKKYYNQSTVNYFHTVEIQISDGKKHEIDCRELDFEYNTIS